MTIRRQDSLLVYSRSLVRSISPLTEAGVFSLKIDKVFLVGIPDWAIDLDEDYKAAIFAFFMSEQIFGTDESETEEEIRET